MNVILASASPRRRVLLKRICQTFEIVTADVDERAVEEKILKICFEEAAPNAPDMRVAARRLCMELAYQKAMAVFEKLGRPKDTVVIGADTSVALPDEILGKPLDRDDAVRMLRKESMEPQYVVTGVALLKAADKELCEARCLAKCRLEDGVLTRQFAAESKVVFNPLDEEQERRLQAYCDTDEPFDKAGAYGLQDTARSLVHHYEGDFSNIVGFPVDEVEKELNSFVLL